MSRSHHLARYALASALALVLAPAAALVHAQEVSAETAQTSQDDPATDATAQRTQTLDNVVVTGSRIKRSEVEGPAPVKVLSAEKMKEEGFTTVHDALSTVTEATGPVQNDYDWGQTSVNASPLNLRNMGPGRTLLLLNGRRVADYPMPYEGKSNFANFNNIPMGIVERIEVLSGSASAIYGSDAVAGVVNVVLKTDIDGDTFRARYGAAQRGGRINRDFEWSGGKSGDKWGVTYSMQMYQRGVLLAGDRAFMDSDLDRPYDARGPEERYFGVGAVAPGTAIYLQDVDRFDPNYSTRYRIAPPAGACSAYGKDAYDWNLRRYNRNTGAVTDLGSYCAQDVYRYWGLRNGTENFSTYLYGTYDFDNDVQAWASYGYWDSQGTSNTFRPGWSSGVYWDANANNGAGGARNQVKYFAPAEIGGAEQIPTRSNEIAWDLAFGLRGRVFADRFDWEVSIGRAEYDVDERFPAILQAAANAYFLGPQLGTRDIIIPGGGPDPVSVPIYAPDPNYRRLWNPIQPSDYRAFAPWGRKQARSWLDQASAVISGDLFEGWAGPIGFAGSLETARQGYSLRPDPNTVGVAPVYETPFGNIEQGGGERNRYAAGVEFKIPLAQSLTMSVAGRYDKYDAVASDAATTWNAGLEWRPFNNLLLRGSYGTSFRAPDMHFVYAAPSTSVADHTDYLRCIQQHQENGTQIDGCPRIVGSPYYIDNVQVARQGTPGLLYETGESYTYGLVWDAFEGFSLSADYWNIRLEDQIDDIQADQVLLDEAYCRTGLTPDGLARVSPPSQALCALQISRVTRDPVTGVVTRIEQGPINRSDQEVAGVDVTGRYAFDTARWGDFSFNLGYTNQLVTRGRNFPGDDLDDKRPDNVRSKITATASWSYHKWTTTLFMSQKSGGRSVRWGGCAPFSDGHVPAAPLNCFDPDVLSPTYGQSTYVVRTRRTPRRYFNASVGYQVNDALRLNLAINNLLDKRYDDPYHGDFAYSYDDPVGREWAAELVYRFD